MNYEYFEKFYYDHKNKKQLIKYDDEKQYLNKIANLSIEKSNKRINNIWHYFWNFTTFRNINIYETLDFWRKMSLKLILRI